MLGLVDIETSGVDAFESDTRHTVSDAPPATTPAQ